MVRRIQSTRVIPQFNQNEQFLIILLCLIYRILCPSISR